MSARVLFLFAAFWISAGAVRHYVTRAPDMDRYLAYCNAALGRPYDAAWVRTAADWNPVFTGNAIAAPNVDRRVSPSRPLVPYRDFMVEYPPGFFLAALPPALITSDSERYGIAFGVFMLALLVAALFVCVRIAARVGGPAPGRLLAWTIASLLAMGVITMQRYDALVALLICTMCWAAMSGRPRIFGIAAGAALMVKIVPVLVAVACGMYLVRGRAAREARTAVCYAVVSGLTICAPLVLAGASFADLLRYHLHRPPEIESTAAAIVGLWHAVEPVSVTVTHTYGATNIAGGFADAAATFAALATVTGLGAAYVWLWRALSNKSLAARDRALVAGAAAVLVVYITCGKVGSPQYLVWLLPIGIVSGLQGEGRLTPALLLAAMALSQIIFPALMPALESLRPWALGLVLARTLLLVAWCVRLRPTPSQ